MLAMFDDRLAIGGFRGSVRRAQRAHSTFSAVHSDWSEMARSTLDLIHRGAKMYENEAGSACVTLVNVATSPIDPPCGRCAACRKLRLKTDIVHRHIRLPRTFLYPAVAQTDA
ncbi:hypothetical protein N7532_008090 [Penicillium argentinense]|uniref:Uncharacterized protein n=1 Tax=Penicillium argentinense TaxID=1131581 RepID=A0A9W9EWX5_9EURO|nr:uncharacterized protein N7532_008090 [Penicillium argentinense]KAJ5089406.1 hypothetical protein N7532_008090 [Penicillium argentinense]